MFCFSHHCCYLKTSACSWFCVFQNIEFVLLLWLDSDVIMIFAAGSIFIYLLFFWVISLLSLNIQFIIFVGFYSSSLFVRVCCFIFNVQLEKNLKQQQQQSQNHVRLQFQLRFTFFIFFLLFRTLALSVCVLDACKCV